jgi:hypothetical protein
MVLPTRAEAQAPPPVTHRTVYATTATPPENGPLWRLTLDARGGVRARTRVVPEANAVALDLAAVRLAFRRPGDPRTPDDDEIWVREASGRIRFLTSGRLALFTPGRTALLVVRPTPAGTADRLLLYRFAAGSVRLVFTQSRGRHVADLRYSADGRSVWMSTFGPQGWVGMQELRPTEHRIVRTALSGMDGCGRVELLPGGRRALLACDGGPGRTSGDLLVFDLTTARVTARHALPAHHRVLGLHGRLNETELLTSMSSDTYWLGAWDVCTATLRRLPGSIGYGEGVAAYEPYAHQP